MQKEFSDWSVYNRWLILDCETIGNEKEEKVLKNYEKYEVNKLEEIDGKIIIDIEEKVIEEE